MPLRTITTQKNMTSLGKLTHIREGNSKYDGAPQEWKKQNKVQKDTLELDQNQRKHVIRRLV